MQIGAPTNVVHVSHMGYTPDGGFSFDENPLPVEWKKLFRAAGVRLQLGRVAPPQKLSIGARVAS